MRKPPTEAAGFSNSGQGELRFPVHKFEAQAKWRQRNPLKRWCHVATQSALKKGVITRQPCEVCGEAAEAHHSDHRQPLQIRWRCRLHHKELEAAEKRLKAEEVAP